MFGSLPRTPEYSLAIRMSAALQVFGPPATMI